MLKAAGFAKRGENPCRHLLPFPFPGSGVAPGQEDAQTLASVETRVSS